MNKAELLEIIQNGENSGVEFKREDIHPQSLAKEIASLANLEGGYILIGVEDDGNISGISRPDIEEWVMNICYDNVQPPIIPYFEIISLEGDKKVGVITIPEDSPDKPYKARQQNKWISFVRIGSTTREATREEEQRLYQSAGIFRYDIKPVPGTCLKDLDLNRLINYFRDIRQQNYPKLEDIEQWERLLINTEIMVESYKKAIPSVGGMLLFGKNPNRHLPQAGISATAYHKTEKDYEAIERCTIRGPIVGRFSETEDIIETGVIERAIEFVRRNTRSKAVIETGRRIDKPDYPEEAIRETVVNAIVHRDYTITGTDIELSIYSDRLEVISPGRLPNTVTIERMKAGCRVTRNELIKEVLRDYHYVEATGLGVPRKIIAGMLKHNNTEPDLIEEESSFMVRLWREKSNVGG
jgi:ATP-dependent DNA helicase RecG